MLYWAMDAITRAIAACGGQQADLARRLVVSPQALSQWVQGTRTVPAARCPDIERETGVRCEELRPDLTWTRNTAGKVTGYHVPLAA